MRKITLTLSITMTLTFLGCCTGPGGKHYGLNNPLRLYDGGLPMENIFKAVFMFPRFSKPSYTNQGYAEWSGILSNTNFVTVIGKSNLAHIFYAASMWQTNLYTNIVLSNDKYFDEFFIHANEKYFVTLTTNYQIKVYLISNIQLVFQDALPRHFSIYSFLGNGKSDLFAYPSGFTTFKLVTLSNTNIIYQGEGFYPCAFSQKNKYLIYADFREKDKFYFWDDYLYDQRKDLGQPFIYDIQNNTNYSIATYQCLDTGIGFNRGEYGTTSAMGLHDGFYAIDYSLSNIYIYICDPAYTFVYDMNLYDGTYAPDAEGLYRIDISSLGLSE
jgi:hypothetical protein